VDTDCLHLVSLISDLAPDRSTLMHLVSEIKRLV
jgi:hypothetical protein